MTKAHFAVVELAAFTLPGVAALAGYPRTGLAILLAYWAAHTAGGTSAYKAYKSKSP